MIRRGGWETSEIFPKFSEIRQGRSKDFMVCAFEASRALHFCVALGSDSYNILIHVVTFVASKLFHPAEAHGFGTSLGFLRVPDFMLMSLYFSGSDPRDPIHGAAIGPFSPGLLRGYLLQAVAADRGSSTWMIS